MPDQVQHRTAIPSRSTSSRRSAIFIGRSVRRLLGGPGVFVAVLLFLATAAQGSHSVVIKEYDRIFKTYPYSDPDPIPTMSKFYPYFRYDGFTATPVGKTWRVIELENEFIQVLVLPEIGGKIWSAVDRASGKPFIYSNSVVKFRDVSMRGPWTSGGIEANYGIMGHTPNCFSPVDYLVRRNADGSASCFIGVLDLLTRSTWRLEIKLAPGEACFSTRSFWHNASGLDQPSYTWMNAGIKSAGNLELISPGTHYIGHDGDAHRWPIDEENHHRVSWYEQNNFGGYKSYHVLGALADFFGAYWHDEDFGMAHCSPYGDKPGRKFWIWGLSRQGMIWEDLLTDGSGQYVEVQSGRSYSQADEESTRSPFKHREFPPFATDTWTENWMPVKGIHGFVSASPWGAMNVTHEEDKILVRICPARPLNDKLEVFNGPKLLFSGKIDAQPLQPVVFPIPASGLHPGLSGLRVALGGDKLEFVPEDAARLFRPLASPAEFDWNTPAGRYLTGQEHARQRDYVSATESFQQCLAVDPSFVPAMVELAGLANRRGASGVAVRYAGQALSIDTYDPGANYQFGLACSALGRHADAQAAFGLASQSMAWRGAAGTELAKDYLRQRRYSHALGAAARSLEANANNLDALGLRACVHRLQGDRSAADTALKIMLDLDPLNHLARAEQYLGGRLSLQAFRGLVRNELPQETFLELAAWYRNAGLDENAVAVLEAGPRCAEALFWIAYLRKNPRLLAAAEAISPAEVFPFRTESVSVFRWAIDQDGAWQPKYYLALIRWFQGELPEACALLSDCGELPQFAPFYAARAQLMEDRALEDLRTAARLAPEQWRYGALLAKRHLAVHDPESALNVATAYAGRFPENGNLAVLQAKALLLSGRHEAAAHLLATLHLLPSEGSVEARGLYHEANLMVAVDHLKVGNFDAASRSIQAARAWPEQLGAGKPHPVDIDERLDDWVEHRCELARGERERAQAALVRLLAWSPRPGAPPPADLLRALALKASGRVAEGRQVLLDMEARGSRTDASAWAVAVFAGDEPPAAAINAGTLWRVLAALPAAK